MNKSPSSIKFPSELTKKGEKVWSYILRRYADHIFDEKRLIDDQWEKAIKLFEHVCEVRNIQPYKKGKKYIAEKIKRISQIYQENRKCKKC